MIDQRQETITVLAGLGIGFILVVLAPFALTGGFLLGLAMLVPLLVALHFVGLGIAGMRLVRLIRTREEVSMIAIPAARVIPEGVPIVARLVETQGFCAQKIQYAVGDEFIMEDSRTVTPEMCGPARHGLVPYVQSYGQVRTGIWPPSAAPFRGACWCSSFALKRECLWTGPPSPAPPSPATGEGCPCRSWRA